MPVIIDANIVISSLVAGNIADLIFSDKLKLVAPELLFIEIRKHKKELIARSQFSEQEFEIVLSVLESRIRIIPLEEFAKFIPMAEELLNDHVKDVPYIALGLKLKYPIWSYEKRFSKIEGIECLTTEEVSKIVKS